MIPKRFGDISKADIDSLVANGVPEGRTLDYKRTLPGGKDDEKREFLADVSSFANAAGGDILFGVDEDQGAPTVANGLPGIDPDAEILRLDNSIRSGIEPRVPAVQIKAVDGFPAGPVMVLRVPKSWSSPHMVTFKGSSRFFSRTNAGKFQMDVAEIRSAFLLSAELAERIKRFRDDRLAKIISDETPVPLEPKGKIILHMLPINAFTQPSVIDVRPFATGGRCLDPIVDGPFSGRLNVDGFVSCWPLKTTKYACYTQLFRSGIIEAVDGFSLIHNGNLETAYEHRLVVALGGYLKLLSDLEIEPPVVVLLSLVGFKGARMLTEAGYFDPIEPNRVPVVDRDVLVLPDVLVEDFSQAPAMILKPLFDTVWQAAGHLGSLNYDGAGNWVPKCRY